MVMGACAGKVVDASPGAWEPQRGSLVRSRAELHVASKGRGVSLAAQYTPLR